MLSRALLPEFDHEMATTRKLLESLPDEHLDWKPHAKSYSLGALATHITNIPTWMGITIDRDEVDMSGPFPERPTGNRADLLDIFDRNVADARARLAGADDRTLLTTWSLKAGDEVLLAMPKVAVIRSFVMNHTIHHRGQLTVYLRLKDVPLPAVYGPTADEQTS